MLWITTIQISTQLEYVTTLIKQFQFTNLHLIGSSSEIKLPFIKSLFVSGYLLNTQSDIYKKIYYANHVTTHTIVFLNYHNNSYKEIELPNNSYSSIIIVSYNHQFEELLNTIASKTKLHQKIFLFKRESQEIHEAYTVNNVIIKKKLGGIDFTAKKFLWEPYINSDFIKRRSDFHGAVLKGVVQFDGLNMNANSLYLENAPYFSNNDSYDITEYTYGSYKDILLILQEQLNFTTILYKRRKEVWGYVYPLSNGSYVGTGLIGDVFFKEADIAVTSLWYVIDRARYVNFLPPIQPYWSAVYIPLTDNEDGINIGTYFFPFTSHLWMAVLLTGTIFALMKLFFLRIIASKTRRTFGFDHIWTSFTAFFGGKPAATPIDSKQFYRTITVVTLLCGTVIWIYYRSRLTAELAVTFKVHPFTDMVSFSKTNWRHVPLTIGKLE